MCARKEISFSFKNSPPAPTGARQVSLFLSVSPPATHSPIIINITKCILIAFFFVFIFFFVLLFCFARRPAGVASSALARHPQPFVSPFWSVRWCRFFRARADIKKARRCVINNQRQTMIRQMSQRTAARATTITTPTTHVQMGSTAINYTILHYNCARCILFYSSLCFFMGHQH